MSKFQMLSSAGGAAPRPDGTDVAAVRSSSIRRTSVDSPGRVTSVASNKWIRRTSRPGRNVPLGGGERRPARDHLLFWSVSKLHASPPSPSQSRDGHGWSSRHRRDCSEMVNPAARSGGPLVSGRWCSRGSSGQSWCSPGPSGPGSGQNRCRYPGSRFERRHQPSWRGRARAPSQQWSWRTCFISIVSSPHDCGPERKMGSGPGDGRESLLPMLSIALADYHVGVRRTSPINTSSSRSRDPRSFGRYGRKTLGRRPGLRRGTATQ
jgi:hypothetical protein